MDAHTFDAALRIIASAKSRRQALRLLTVGAFGVWVPRRGLAAPARQDETCDPGLSYCEEEPNWAPAGCYDLSSDYLHCGACGQQCPSAGPVEMACIDGACTAVNCGDLTDCTGNLDCTDLSSDPNNCGDCGIVCDSGACNGGVCTQSGCAAGTWDCDGNGICTSLLDDPYHCGDCVTVCASGVCNGGFCAPLGCEPGLVACPYSEHFGPAGCYDLATDPDRCGSCYTSCGGAGSRTIQECLEGSCVATGCLEGFVDCTGNLDCASLADDPNNCGACGVVCPSGVCVAWSCASEDSTCGEGLAYCPSKVIAIGANDEPYEVDAGCYDLSSDNIHCGECDNTCATTVPCYAGECRLPPA